MAYNEELTDRLRQALADVPKVQERRMFRGIAFMVDGKMCMTVGDTRLMCRIDPALHATAVERNGVSVVKMRGREYRGFLYVEEATIRSPKDLKHWVDLCLDYNKRAKASKKRKANKAQTRNLKKNTRNN
jgi:TfoX/Sxy family transcriptional regulator of competence genes